MANFGFWKMSKSEVQQKNINDQKHHEIDKYQYRYLAKQTVETDQPLYYYPVYEIKPIVCNIPEVYYKRKVIPKAPPEPNYLQKIQSREVDPEKLSVNQKKFAGKTLFEKDLIIIRSKNEMLENYEIDQIPKIKKYSNRSKSVSMPLKKKDDIELIQSNRKSTIETSQSKPHFKRKKSSNPPNCFYREEEIRKAKNDKVIEEIRMKEEREKRQEQFLKHKLRKSKPKTVDIDIDSLNLPKEPAMIAEKEQELMEKNEEMKHSFRRPTRSSLLRDEAIHNKLEAERSSQKNEEKMQKLKDERLKQHTKKLVALIASMNPYENLEVKARQRKEELKKLEGKWNKWLVTNQQSNAFKQTMLEKTYNMTD